VVFSGSHIIKTKGAKKEKKDTSGRMRLQLLAMHDWHFDGSYSNLTLIGLIMMSASLL